MTDLNAPYSRLTVTRFHCRQTFVLWTHTILKKPIAGFLIILGLAFKSIGVKRKGIDLILKGRRVDPINGSEALIREVLKYNQNDSSLLSSLLHNPTNVSPSQCAVRTLLLKLPTISNEEVVEKGALIIKFTETFPIILSHVDVPLLSKYFHIILEPSWVGYSLPEILTWAHPDNGKVTVLSLYKDDFDLLKNLNSNLIPIQVGPSDWVNTHTFHSTNSEKVYDAIYVANFNPIKRVDRFLRAVVRITKKRKDYRVALVCAGHGSARHAILETLKWAKNKANIDYFSNVNQAALNSLYNQSKVNVLVSLREGSNKGVSEGFFSGTPAILLSECACGNHNHINEHTGKVCRDADLEEALIWFADNYTQFDARTWAQTHISPEASSITLSNKLREIELSEGRLWTKALMPKVNQPEMAYLNAADNWLLDARAPLLDAFARGKDAEIASKFVHELIRLQLINNPQ